VVVYDLFVCAGVVEEVSIVFVVLICVCRVYIYIGHHHIYILSL